MSPLPAARRAALLLLGVAILAGVAAAAPVAVDGLPPAAIVDNGNATAALQPAPDDPSGQTYLSPDVDVSVAVGGDVAALRGRHESLAFTHRLAADETRSERLATIRERVSRMQNRLVSIQRAHREARNAYRDGSLSRAGFARQLAILDARTGALESLRATVERRTSSLNPQPRTTLTNAQNLEATLETLRGPTIERLRRQFLGNASTDAVYVSVAGPEGLVLATVEDGTFYRDAVDERERDPEGGNGFSESGEPEISVALRRAAEIYPWAFDNGDAAEPLRGYGDTAVYRITVQHTQGRLSTYLDGATGNVFREIQRLRVAAVPPTTQQVTTADSLRLRINGTYDTGPMEVRVVRNATGIPLDAAVTVDGQVVGRTGEDGRLWTVQPVGRVTVTARTSGNATVETTVG
jgi:hypothetical protein